MNPLIGIITYVGTYRLYVEGDAGHFIEEHRNNLYPVMADGN